jgi:hypothetical protein
VDVHIYMSCIRKLNYMCKFIYNGNLQNLDSITSNFNICHDLSPVGNILNTAIVNPF